MSLFDNCSLSYGVRIHLWYGNYVFSSRLGCQIRVTKEFDGIKVRIPDDGY